MEEDTAGSFPRPPGCCRASALSWSSRAAADCWRMRDKPTRRPRRSCRWENVICFLQSKLWGQNEVELEHNCTTVNQQKTNAPFLSSLMQAWFSISKCYVGSATFGFFTSFGSKRSRDSDGLVFSSLPKETLELMVLRCIQKHPYFNVDIRIQISCVSTGGYGNLDSDTVVPFFVCKGFVKTRVVLSC